MVIRIFANDIIKKELQSRIKSGISNPKNVKFYLSSILAMVACLSLHAVEQTMQPNTLPNDSSSIIHIAEDAKIYGKELLVVKQKKQQTFAKKASQTKSITIKPAKRNISKKEPPVVVFPDFPFIPSSPSYLNISNESVIMDSQQKLYRLQPARKTNRENVYPDIKTSYLTINLPEQRQKLSIAATQCGILTSFGPNSPSRHVD